MIEDKIELLRSKIKNVEDEIDGINFDYRDNVEEAFHDGINELEEEIEELEKLKSSIQSKDNREEAKKLERSFMRKAHDLEGRIQISFGKPLNVLDEDNNGRDDLRTDFDLKYTIIDNLREYLDLEFEMVPHLGDGFWEQEADLGDSKAVVFSSPIQENGIYMFYPILAHEIGHVYVHENQSIFNEYHERFEEVMDEKERRAERQSRRRFKKLLFKQYWQAWREELAADVIAAEIMGKSYFYSLYYKLGEGDPYDVNHSHPPTIFRLKTIAKVCGKLNSPKIKDMESRFEPNHRYNTYVEERLVDALIQGITEQLNVEYEGENNDKFDFENIGATFSQVWENYENGDSFNEVSQQIQNLRD